MTDSLTLPRRAIRKLSRAILSRIHAPRLDVEPSALPTIKLGTPYGGWRFVDTEALHGAVIVSCGLGEDASFDVEFAAAYRARVVIVDPTPRAIRHFDGIVSRCGQPRARGYVASGEQPVEAYDLSGVGRHQLELCAKALWNEEKTLRFYKPQNHEHLSHSIVNFQNDYRTDSDFIEVTATTIDRLIADHDAGQLQLLKLDIEGAEIEVLIDLLARGLRPPQLLVEYDELLAPSSRSKGRIESAHAALRAAGYRLIHFDRPSNFLYTLLPERH